MSSIFKSSPFSHLAFQPVLHHLLPHGTAELLHPEPPSGRRLHRRMACRRASLRPGRPGALHHLGPRHPALPHLGHLPAGGRHDLVGLPRRHDGSRGVLSNALLDRDRSDRRCGPALEICPRLPLLTLTRIPAPAGRASRAGNDLSADRSAQDRSRGTRLRMGAGRTLPGRHALSPP